MRFGGYEHRDMSNSRYVGEIRERANELTNSERLDDLKSAVENYGSIGALDEMDLALRKIHEKDSRSGLIWFDIGEKIHEFYGNSGKRE